VIEAGTAAGLSNIATFATGGTATAVTVHSVPNGTYFVRVRARSAEGTSGASNETTIVVGGATGGPCAAPSAPAGFAATVSGNTLTLTWNAVAGALSYVIEAGSAPGATNVVTFDTGSAATSFAGNAPNGTYYLRVRARTSCGTSGTSNEATVTVGATAPGPGASLTGRWVGLQASGDGATSTPNECGVERWDWQLDLVQNGAAVTGTLTQTVVASGCPFGPVQTLNLTGSVSGNTLTLRGYSKPDHWLDINATVAGTRMTGTGLVNGGAYGTASVALNRQ
jgi:predicted phage tail protein